MALSAQTRSGEIALAALECLSRRDYDGMRRFVSRDVVVEWPYAGRDIVINHGFETMLRLLGPLNILDAFSLTPTALHETADRVIVEGESHGTRADGPDYHNRYVFIMTVKDDRVERWREYFNPVEGKNLKPA